MIDPVVVGLVLCLGSSVLFGVATVFQAIGVRRRERVSAAGAPSATDSASGLLRLVSDRWYVAGSVLDFVGAVASAIALQHLPLFIVESCVAASLAVTVVIAVPVLDLHVTGREILALVVVGVGLVLLSVSSTEGPARALTGTGLAVLLGGLVAIAIVGLIAWQVISTTSSLPMAIVTGLSFTGMALAERTLALPDPWWQVIGDPTFYAVLGYGAVGISAYATAIARGKVTTVMGITFAVETLVPSVIGLALLDDTYRGGFAPIAGLGFIAAVGGAIALTRVGEVA